MARGRETEIDRGGIKRWKREERKLRRRKGGRDREKTGESMI